jgi:hypothetical protein
MIHACDRVLKLARIVFTRKNACLPLSKQAKGALANKGCATGKKPLWYANNNLTHYLTASEAVVGLARF